MRKTIVKGLYLLLTEMIAVYLVAFPVHAFQVSSSSTGYVRVATASAVSAYQVAQRAAFTSALASAVSAPTVASVAVRIATGPVGWGLLGVSAAVTLAGMYYDSASVQAVKTAAIATLPTTIAIPGYTAPAGSGFVEGCIPLVNNCMQRLFVPAGNVTCTGTSTGTVPGGWSAGFRQYGTPSGMAGPDACYHFFFITYGGSNGSQLGSNAAPTSLSQAAADTYINSLAPSSPTSVESHTSPLGQGATAPAADNVTTLPVTPAQVVPTVKPASQVAPTDAVIDPNAPPPAGPQPAVPSTQTTTTTTTTTTNPDGSVTQHEDSTGSVACSAGNHDQRTFGSVLQDHINQWQGSGLLSALNLLKTLTWPTAIPTYSLQSNLLGTFTLDFSAWSGMLTAIRSIIIALAGFVAYRIIFVGSK